MTIAEIRAFRNAEPFRPFGFRTTAGDNYPVRHPERIAYQLQGTTVFVWGLGQEFKTFDLADISAIEILPKPPRPQLDDIPDLFA